MGNEQKQSEKNQMQYPGPSFPYGERQCWEQWEGCQGVCVMLGYCVAVKEYSSGPSNGNGQRHKR